jgi:hypothetical protein
MGDDWLAGAARTTVRPPLDERGSTPLAELKQAIHPRATQTDVPTAVFQRVIMVFSRPGNQMVLAEKGCSNYFGCNEPND